MKAIHEGTVWKVSKYGIYGKYRSEITPYFTQWETYEMWKDIIMIALSKVVSS